MKNRLLVAVVLLLIGGGSAALAAAATPAGSPVENLTLEQALELADNLHPQLAEARALVQAAEGRVRQAGAFPNPEAIVGAQQLPLRDNQPNEKEYVAGVAQPIPLGSRLGKARQAEWMEREVRARGLQAKRRDIRKRVHSAFATALYQDHAWQAQSEIRQNAEKAVATTRARVEAGDAPKEDLARVEIELARARVELHRAESLREQGRAGLAAAIGDGALKVASLAGTMDATFEIPTLEALVASLADLPETALADAELRARAARVDLARSERIPDVKVELLYHRLEATRADTVDVGLSLPLPLFHRNPGKLEEARAEQAAAEARARMTRSDLSAKVREAHLQLGSALAGSRIWQNEILSKAETLLNAAEARYAAGDISLAELLPLRRDWASMRLSYLESLRDVMQAWAVLSPYLGKP